MKDKGITLAPYVLAFVEGHDELMTRFVMKRFRLIVNA